MILYYKMFRSILIMSVNCVLITCCFGCYFKKRPDPVHGSWGSWSSFKPAVDDRDCVGTTTKKRLCNNPSPQHGGNQCSGKMEEVEPIDCNECAYRNGGCQQVCENFDYSYTCICLEGYYKAGTQCKINPCETSKWPTPANGKKTTSECQDDKNVQFGKSCTVKCNNGYALTGSSISTCGLYGKWSPSSPPNCKVITCNSIHTQDHMDVSPPQCTSNPLAGTVCTISCTNGFSLMRYSKPSHTTTCSGGEWTDGGSFHCKDLLKPKFTNCPREDITVICEKMKTKAIVSLDPIEANDNDGLPPIITVYPTTASYFELAEGRHTITYIATDTSRNSAQCNFKVNVKVMRCRVLSPPSKGRTMPPACSTLLGSKCNYECYDGFNLTGSSSRECIRDSLNGKWTGNDPICKQITCPPLPLPLHGKRTGLGCNGVNPSYQTLCIFECVTGYKLVSGSEKRICKADGQWTGEKLRCQIITCPALPPLSEGLDVSNPACIQDKSNYSKECRYSCAKGYLLLGPTTKICSATAQWSSGGNAYCKDIFAPSFKSCPKDIKRLADKHSRSVRVNWTVPIVTDNAPDKPSVVHQGKSPGDEFSVGHHTIKYVTTDKTGNTAQCLFQVIVEIIKCPVLSAPLRGTVTCTLDNVYGSQCKFVCNIGHTLKGSATITCEKNEDELKGRWTGKTPICAAITCPPLDQPKDGYKSSCLTNSFGEKCLFYCNRGYKGVAGSSSRTCLENGNWTGSTLICKVVNCSVLMPHSPLITITPAVCFKNPTYQTTCQYLCPTGYRLNGLSIKTCLTSGEWNHHSNVSCQDIERPRFTTQCPNSIDVFAPENKYFAVAVGTIPVISATDNSGEVPTIKVTGQKQNYSAGNHEIRITATDSSGNIETCKFYVNVKILRCFTHPAHITNGQVVGSCGNTWGSTCRFKCDEGFNMTGSSYRTCKVIPGQMQGYWNGTMPFCTMNRCRPLKTPVKGYVYPPMCVSKQGPASGTACLFGCYYGFHQSAGISTITCGKDTKWDKNISTIITCKDKTPPQFISSCPLDIRVLLGNNGLAIANWTIPVAEDNTRVLPKITVKPSDAIPPYTVNKTTDVTYTAQDDAGNVGKCIFRIIVEDNVGPRVVYCPGNITKKATQLADIVTWKTPEFADNSNVKVNAKCNRHSGESFYWGKWNIHCTGYDKNPNNPPAICSFTVTVSPKPCPLLKPPKNGAKACAAWMMGFMCSPMCNDKYDFAVTLPYGAMWVCGAKGKWMPTDALPDCSAQYSPGTARKTGKLFYFSGNCHNVTVQTQIKLQFISIIKKSFFEMICTDPQMKEKCVVSNVDVKCGMQQKDIQAAARRKRRSADPSVMKILFVVSVALSNGSNHQTKKEIKSQVLNATHTLEKITAEIQQMAENGSLELNVTNEKLLPVKGSASFSKTTFTCDSGQIFVSDKCVSCPVGTYHNTTYKDCLHCPKGRYQNNEGQTTCIRCPPGMSTIQEQSKNDTECLALCQPGYSSPTGLQPCIPCAKGFYQTRHGQKKCFNCTVNTTTEKEGSISIRNCSAPCGPGSSSSTGLHPCTRCIKGSYQPYSEEKSCFKCPGTTVTSNTGSSKTSDCIEINECLSNPCQGGSTCIDLIGDYDCLCQPGYNGKQCNSEIDECASNPCQNNATCHDMLNSYKCNCLNGFKGDKCDIEINECEGSPCLNNATCRDFIGRYECFCHAGFEGERCEKETDECVPNPCLNSGTCHDKVNAFLCQCPRGFRGPTCQENINDCSPNPCKNSGQCIDGIDSYSCSCQAGYTGNTCEKDIDECASSPCKNNATCYNKVGEFSCICVHGYNGTLCEQEINYCLSQPCRNGGTCKSTFGSFSCVCPSGYQGDQCEKDVDECASLPCTNNATCLNTVGSFQCNCVPGFTGQACETDINECLSNPCLNNGSCENLQNGFKCNCLGGFSGSRCKLNIDECAPKPCKNNGTCHDLVNNYKCTCKDGFTGDDCETLINHCAQNPCENNGQCKNLPTDFTCICAKGFAGKNCSENTNECLANPCKNGQCEDLIGNYRCSCFPGFTGDNCTVNIDDCVGNACQSNATCVDGNNTYHCVCSEGFMGRYCEVMNGPCDSLPCFSGGKCTEKDSKTYVCSCPSGFTGKDCQVNFDDCKPNPCKHNGICTDLVSNYICNCPDGFWGKNCEKFIDYCAAANCSNHGNCFNLPLGFKCNCTNGFYGPTCEFHVKKCISSPCKNGGTCNETSSGFNCTCVTGFNGDLCEVNIDDCKEHRCLHNATCVDLVDDYLCLCHDGFNGSYCQHQLHSCKDNPCENNGTCEDVFGGYRCKCPDRYGGSICNVDKSPCLINPCVHGGSCAEVNLTAFTCVCPTGYTGDVCQNNIAECLSAPCPLHANCIDKINGYECVCSLSYTGKNCETPLGDNFDLVFQSQTPNTIVKIPPSSSIVNLMRMLIALWVRPDVRYKRGTIFTYRTHGPHSEMIEISFNEGIMRVLVQKDELQSPVNITDGKWHFIGVSWSRVDEDFSIFFDGKLVGGYKIPFEGPPIKGGGEVVLGKKYSTQDNTYTTIDSFVGTLHQVNFWHMPSPGEDYMWNAAHSCSWPLEGNIYSWIAFMEGVKSNVLKKFPSTCKSLDLCKANCSHYVECHKEGKTFVCTCKNGFTGNLCDINIDDCGSNSCIHGHCVDDIASYRCECKKGYYGRQCQHKQHVLNKECPSFGKLNNGKVIKESYEGKHVVHLKCDEKYSFKQDAVTKYECGPQTNWQWNSKAELTLPKCLSIAEPLEIKRTYAILLPLDPTQCKTNKEYQQIESSFKQVLQKVIQDTEQHGCFMYGPCKTSKFSIPKCAPRRSQRSSENDLGVNFELLFKEWGNSSVSTVTETAEAIGFYLKYAVTVGSFVMTVNGKAVKPRMSSFMVVAKSYQCREGYVSGNDNSSCVGCPIGTYEHLSDCLPCPKGQYQDSEGRSTCIACPSGHTTDIIEAISKDQCLKNKINENTYLWKIALPIVLVIVGVVVGVGVWYCKKRQNQNKIHHMPDESDKTQIYRNKPIPLTPVKRRPDNPLNLQV